MVDSCFVPTVNDLGAGALVKVKSGRILARIARRMARTHALESVANVASFSVSMLNTKGLNLSFRDLSDRVAPQSGEARDSDFVSKS